VLLGEQNELTDVGGQVGNGQDDGRLDEFSHDTSEGIFLSEGWTGKKVRERDHSIQAVSLHAIDAVTCRDDSR
jgi:hypothetical protein